MALADSWMRARCSSVRNGAGASSTSFWLRRCSEQSRVPTTITFPWVSASTCASTWRGLSRNFSTKDSPRPNAETPSRTAQSNRPGVDDRLGEVGVLREEAVARVDGVGTGLLRGVDDLVDHQVGVARGGTTEG